MDWYRSSSFYAVFTWLWRIADFVRRFLRAVWFRAVEQVTRMSLSQQAEVGESEAGGQSADPAVVARGDPTKRLEEKRGQGEAPAAKRDTGFGGQGLGCGAGRQGEDDFSGREYRVQETDEFYCEYDSTWEVEKSGSISWPFGSPKSMWNGNFQSFKGAARDMHKFRQDCRDADHIQHMVTIGHRDMPNLDFYLGKRRSKPDNALIQDFHDEWRNDYFKLEYVHTYIQWLFPLQEPGMNYEAKPMTREEVQRFRSSDLALSNLLESYKLMLGFYGIRLRDETTGEVERAQNWRTQFDNLNRNSHNNLRITRILKCLGMLGFKRFQPHLVHFFLYETLVNRELPAVKESVLSYFLFAVIDRRERRKLLKFAYLHYQPRNEFVWCPKKVQQHWSRQKQDRERGGAGRHSGSSLL